MKQALRKILKMNLRVFQERNSRSRSPKRYSLNRKIKERWVVYCVLKMLEFLCVCTSYYIECNWYILRWQIKFVILWYFNTMAGDRRFMFKTWERRIQALACIVAVKQSISSVHVPYEISTAKTAARFIRQLTSPWEHLALYYQILTKGLMNKSYFVP